MIGQIVSGYAIQTTHSFFAAFAIACCVLLAGVFGYSVLIGKPEEQCWSSAISGSQAPATEDPYGTRVRS